jgi:hypothetical protein
MANNYDDDDMDFNSQEAERIVTKVIQDVITDLIYERSKVNTWTQ